ncbi:MAG: hypothetical protein LUG93_08885 [Lachnospiraceae bacterium]|nr:hypothetical protein [Lachnospiraceae bacterium]
MAKKRSCRRTKQENDIHGQAVRIRKMTDEQLVAYIEGEREKAYMEGMHSVPQISEFLEQAASLPGIGAEVIGRLMAFAGEGGSI